jgi:3-hydroxyisobutyrate dehydrogenase-like beta-hydroxyacid dehydrogenase
MSTISPELSRSLHREARTRGVNFLDVAISGSTPAVDAGTITLLAGGDKDTFEQCVPIFESIARQWFLIGPGSSGVQMKLVVNLLLGLDMQAIAEAVSLGEHLQIDRNVLLDVLSKTAVVAPAMAGKFRKIKDNDYSPEFPLRLMSKDMDLVMDAASASGANLPAASVAQSVLASNVSTSGDLDLSAITPLSSVEEQRSRFSTGGIRDLDMASQNARLAYRFEPFETVDESNGRWFLLEDTVDLKLTDKVALVTGSTAGIGFAIARSLAAEGAHVYVNGRTQERVDAAVAAIRSQAATIKSMAS